MWKTRSSLSATVIGLALAGLCSAGPATAQVSAPFAVSPGEQNRATLTVRCPTFSWGPTDGASAYELVVYRLDDSDLQGPDRVLTKEIGGAALGWTPALDQCFESGQRYAWSVRAVLRDGLSQWADPMLFEVGAQPTAEEVAAALDVLRRHRAAESGVDQATGAPESIDGVVRGDPPDSGTQGAEDDLQRISTAFQVGQAPELQIDGEMRSVDTSGEALLWGQGRPGGILFTQFFSTPCTNGAIKFGLSQATVSWGSAAQACPAGSWVCRASEVTACDTTRTDSSCDHRYCDGTCLDRPGSSHYGWVADHHSSTGNGLFFSENGGTGQDSTCFSLPVWCCWK